MRRSLSRSSIQWTVLMVTELFTFGSIAENVHGFATPKMFAFCAMANSATAIAAAGSTKRRSGNDSAARSDRNSDRGAELELKAFMSMDRAVAIVGPDGKLLLPNLIFSQLFGDGELLDRINRDACANNGKT